MATIIEVVLVAMNIVEHTTINGTLVCILKEWHLELERW